MVQVLKPYCKQTRVKFSFFLFQLFTDDSLRLAPSRFLSVQFNSIQFYSHFYKIFTLYIALIKKKKKQKRKFMAWIEVYGGQRSLAFELTTAVHTTMS